MEERIIKEIYSYPNPKYYSIIINNDQLGYLKSILPYAHEFNINEIFNNIAKKEYKFNPGDIIGINPENDVNNIPYVIIYVNNNGYNYNVLLQRQYIKYKETGKYPLPFQLTYINRDELENIYKFPFVKNKTNKIL